MLPQTRVSELEEKLRRLRAEMDRSKHGQDQDRVGCTLSDSFVFFLQVRCISISVLLCI